MSKLFEFIMGPVMPILAKVFKVVAITGIGSEQCLKNGFLPVPIHFYQPIPDLTDLAERKIWDKKSDMAGIDFGIDRQVKLLRELGAKYGHECNWSPSPTSNPLDFFTEINSFSFGCAASLYTIIRNYRPSHVIEVSSGNSSKIFSAALARNPAEGAIAEYTIIDPYPADIIKILPGVKQIIPKKVEVTDLQRFETLGHNDILFINSSHTVRIGSDVNFLYLDVLPRLAQGVIVHIHDIGLPYEYPKVYFTNPAFRVFWTEAYLLQAFLSLNPHFEIMLAMNYLTADHWDGFCKAFEHFNPDVHKATSSSFWIRRVS